MKRALLVALTLVALSWPAHAQDASSRFTIMNAFDLDAEAADVDQVIAATALVDNGTSVDDTNWTILAQPDACRLLDLTIVDTNLNVGTITVAGSGCLGEARSCSFAFTTGDDTGVKTLTCTDSEGAYFSTVSTVTTGTMTGESDETFALGYSTGPANGWGMYGRLIQEGPGYENGVDPTRAYESQRLITTSGSCSNTVAGVDSDDDVFESVSAGDLLFFTVRNSVGATQSYERKITARASADSVTIGGSCVNIPAAGVTFSWKKWFFSTNPADRMFVPVGEWKTADFTWSIDANANTGGVVMLLECSSGVGPEWPTGKWVSVATTTVATGGTQASTVEAVDLSLASFRYCRFGLKIGTGDDADAAAEDINAEVTLRK